MHAHQALCFFIHARHPPRLIGFSIAKRAYPCKAEESRRTPNMQESPYSSGYMYLPCLSLYFFPLPLYNEATPFSGRFAGSFGP